MADTTLSDALAEAFASAPAEMVVIDTISIYYAGLTTTSPAVPTELYLFNGTTGDSLTAAGAPLKNFKLESTATINPSTIVSFIGLPFAITQPDVGSDPLAKGQLLIDGVGREAADLMLAAIDLGVSIDVTYRPYITGNELIGPEQTPPIKFSLSNVVIRGLTLSADIILPTHGNRRFPRQLYTSSRFPQLAL